MYGVERVAETIRLCKMNLAVHGLSGDIRDNNTYYEDPHKSVGRFDFVMANPPFNVSGVDKERVREDKRFAFGVPSTDNANYLWIQQFYHALNDHGRAGFVMANSAADARGAEMEIRKKLIQAGTVDVMISISPNFFYTVTLPCTLWFFDRAKPKTARKDSVLFIDARNTFRQLDRAHRDFEPSQIEFIANIVRLYRGTAPESICGSVPLMQEQFADGSYHDVAGLCKVASVADIEVQGWSLNPGRYMWVLRPGWKMMGISANGWSLSMRNWSGSMRRPACLRNGLARMWGRSLTGHNPDSVWTIIQAMYKKMGCHFEVIP